MPPFRQEPALSVAEAGLIEGPSTSQATRQQIQKMDVSTESNNPARQQGSDDNSNEKPDSAETPAVKKPVNVKELRAALGRIVELMNKFENKYKEALEVNSSMRAHELDPKEQIELLEEQLSAIKSLTENENLGTSELAHKLEQKVREQIKAGKCDKDIFAVEAIVFCDYVETLAGLVECLTELVENLATTLEAK